MLLLSYHPLFLYRFPPTEVLPVSRLLPPVLKLMYPL